MIGDLYDSPRANSKTFGSPPSGNLFNNGPSFVVQLSRGPKKRGQFSTIAVLAKGFGALWNFIGKVFSADSKEAVSAKIAICLMRTG